MSKKRCYCSPRPSSPRHPPPPARSSPSRPHLPFKCEVYRHSSAFFFFSPPPSRGTQSPVEQSGSRGVCDLSAKNRQGSTTFTHVMYSAQGGRNAEQIIHFFSFGEPRGRTKVGLCSPKTNLFVDCHTAHVVGCSRATGTMNNSRVTEMICSERL